MSLLDPREPPMRKYMFTTIWFTFTEVKKGELGERKMLIAALKKSFLRFQRKKST